MLVCHYKLFLSLFYCLTRNWKWKPWANSHRFRSTWIQQVPEITFFCVVHFAELNLLRLSRAQNIRSIWSRAQRMPQIYFMIYLSAPQVSLNNCNLTKWILFLSDKVGQGFNFTSKLVSLLPETPVKLLKLAL